MKPTRHVISFSAGFLISCMMLLAHRQRASSELCSVDHTLQAHPSSWHLSGPGLARQLLTTTGSANDSSYLPPWSRHYSGYKSRWHPTVLKSVHKAEQLLTSTRKERASRFFVPLLTAHHSELCCMLTDLNKKVAGTNDLDVFVFSVDNAAHPVFLDSVCASREFNMTVIFLAVDEHWRFDHGTNPATSSSAFFDKSEWMVPFFKESYRHMGHWRLTFPFAFADMLGYRYVWQIDDDSFFKTPVAFNMMKYMQNHDVWVGGRAVVDDDFVAWALPEMARLYLVAERMAPMGSLLSNHTQPAGLQGLYSVFNDTTRAANETNWQLKYDEGGWDRKVIYGNCVVMDLEKFWWPKHVQKFVELVVLSGYHFRFRWNEQGVIGMVWQMFVPDANAAIHSLPVDVEHPHKRWGSCP